MKMKLCYVVKDVEGGLSDYEIEYVAGPFPLNIAEWYVDDITQPGHYYVIEQEIEVN